MADINSRRADILENIRVERERQFDLPGSEWDVDKAPNDWVAVITADLGQCSRRNASIPESDDFREMMTKVAAVAVASLEHLDFMVDKKRLRKAETTTNPISEDELYDLASKHLLKNQDAFADSALRMLKTIREQFSDETS